jgi:hypothetical protein
MNLYYSVSTLSTYKGIPLKRFEFVTWKNKISRIVLFLDSFENQEKIFPLLEKNMER